MDITNLNNSPPTQPAITPPAPVSVIVDPQAEEVGAALPSGPLAEVPSSPANVDIHGRAKRGIKLLMGRQVFLQIFTFAGGIVLARVLDPAEFGLYAIATFMVGTLAMLGDFGLAPSFIQRRAELTELDLRVGFTLQQIITTVIVAALLISAPFLVRFYPEAPPDTVWLVRALAFTLYLTSWRSMSALQLERRMHYDRLSWIEVVETLSYQALAVGLAVAGYGVWSFVWATLVRGLLGTILVYLAAPWRIRFGFDAVSAKEILRFGIPFQVQLIASAMTHWITPLLVGSLIGPQAVGYLTWAAANGRKPLLLVDNVVRVAFPHFSRIQDDRAQVEVTLSRYLAYLLIPAGLWFAVLLIAGSSLVAVIYTPKWLPAVPALILFAAAIGLDVVAWMGIITLNSLGYVKYTTRMVFLRGIAHMAFAIPLVLLIGYTGEAVAYLISQCLTVPWLLNGLGRESARRVIAPLYWLLFPVALSVLAGMAVRWIPLPLLLHTILLVTVTILAYAATVWLTAPEWIKEFIRKILAKIYPHNLSVVSS